MAQLKDSVVTGSLRVTADTLTNVLQTAKILAPSTSGGTTYTAGTSGDVLKSNGSTAYWATLTASDVGAVPSSWGSTNANKWLICDGSGNVTAQTITTRTSSNLSMTDNIVTASAGYYANDATYTVTLGEVTSGTATISSVSVTNGSDATKFALSGNANVGAPSIDTAGFISSTQGTKNANTNGATLNASINKIVGTVSLSEKKLTPTISKQNVPSGVTNGADTNTDATTTAPSSGIYVAVKSAENVESITPSFSITTAGYGTNSKHGFTITGATVGAAASSTTYIKIKTATPAFKGGALEVATDASSNSGTTLTTSPASGQDGITIQTKYKANRKVVQYDGTVSGWVTANNEATVLAATNNTSFSNGTLFYLTALKVPANKTLATITNEGTITTLSNSGTVSISSDSTTTGTLNVVAYPASGSTADASQQIVKNGKWQCLPTFAGNGTYYGKVEIPQGTVSQNAPTIDSSTGLITATVNVSAAGYIAAANPADTNTLQLTVKGATIYNVSTSNRTIAAGTYLTGTQTLRKITTSGIVAENIKDGAVIKVGDSGSSTRIKNITGTFTDASTVSSGQTAATASQIFSGYSAWVDGAEVQGNVKLITDTNTTVTLSATSFNFNQTIRTVTVSSVVYTDKDGNNITLVEDTDYTVGGTTTAYDHGTYTVTITGIGAYSGKTTATWTINKINATFTITSGYSTNIDNKSVYTIGYTTNVNEAVNVQTSDSSIIGWVTAGPTGIAIYAAGNGTGTITFTVGSNDDTSNYNITTATTSILTAYYLNDTLSSNVPANIKYAAQKGIAPNIWSVGDLADSFTVATFGKMTTTANLCPFIIGFNHNRDIEEEGYTLGTSSITFMFGKIWGGTDICLVDSGYGTSKYSGNYFSYQADDNSAGWSDSNLYTMCNSSSYFYGKMPTAWQNVAKTVKKYTQENATTSTVNIAATSAKIFLLSEYEVFGTCTYSVSSEATKQQQYTYYANGNSKIKKQHTDQSTAVQWWLRSPQVANNGVYYYWCSVNTSGESAYGNYGSYSLGFAPAWVVG